MLRRNSVLAASLVINCALDSVSFAQASSAKSQVRTFSYGATATAPALWVVDERPALELGGASGTGPTEFSRIMGLARLRDGRIVVANAATTEVRVFSPSGVFERAIGRRGQGPGEFSYLWSLQANADTIFASDNSGRAQVFAANGTLLRSLSRPLPAVGARPARLGLLANGDAIVTTLQYPADTTGEGFLISLAVQRESSSGQRYRVLFQFPTQRRHRGTDGRSVVTLYAPRGKVVARAGRICAGYSERYLVICYDAEGRPIFRIERAVEPRVITEKDRQLAREGYVVGNLRPASPPEARQRFEEESRQFVFADRGPAFGRVLLSSDGDVWVSEFDPTEDLIGTPSFRTPQAPVRWSIYHPSRGWLSDIVLPGRFTPYDVGHDLVTGVSIDSDDVERVTVLRVHR